MARFQKGAPRRLTADTVNKITDTANAGANLVGGVGLTTMRGPGATLVIPSPQAETRAHSVKAHHSTDLTAPMYAVVEFHDAPEGHRGPLLLYCRRPSQSGFARLGILSERGVQPNGVVWVQYEAVTPVLYTGAIAVGDRLGCLKDSYYAQKDALGPFLVMGVPTAELAIVRITGNRGDHKIADADNAAIDGPYQTYIWGPEYTVTQTAPGLIAVELA